MLRWLLVLGFLAFTADLVLSSSDDSLKKGALLKQEAQSELRTIREECERYAAARGELPEGLDRTGLNQLTDPWGNPYRYHRLGPHEGEIVSLGADGVEGGIGLNADLVSRIRIG